MVGDLERGLVAVLLLVLMTGMGTTLTPAAFVDLRDRPKGVLIGLASQFGWMPLIAFGLASVLSLPPPMALGLIIIGCTPGGATSNMFTYYARADLALSVSMTVASTVAAVVLMPCLLWLYTAPFTDASLAIPYGSIATTLLLVLLPVALGMWLRARRPRLAARVERLGSLAGLCVLAVLLVAGLIRNSGAFVKVSASGYLAAIVLGTLGMGLGYALARLAGMARASRRAIALETGVQNSPLAFTIILTSFPEAQQEAMLLLPLGYGLFVLLSASLATLWFRQSAGAPAATVARAGVA